MAARLQPRTDLEVAQQHDAALADDEARAGDVNRVGVTVERRREPADLGDEALDVPPLLDVDGCQGRDGSDDLLAQHLGSVVDAHGSAPYWPVSCRHG